jgi:para-aminobenzoate synthetase component 1
MEIIEELENFQRGLYSGSIGYIAPNGDFDFNVVIRSLLYNQTLKTASLSVGGAITIQSNPEEEYEECLVKIQRIMDGLNE